MEEKLKNGDKIKNVPAYLMKAFEVDFRPEETPYTKLQKKKAEEKQALLDKETQQKQELAIIKANFKQEKRVKLEEVKKGLSEEDLEILMPEFEKLIQDNRLFANAYKSGGFDNTIVKAGWNKFLTERFLPSEYHDFENYRGKHIQMENDAI